MPGQPDLLERESPEYLYRAKSKGDKAAADDNESATEEVLRLLRHAKNTSARNNMAPTVTHRRVEVLWVVPADVAVATKNFAKAQVTVFQSDPNRSTRRNNPFAVAGNCLYKEVSPESWRRGLTGSCRPRSSGQGAP